MDWIVSPQNLYVKVLTPSASECDLFGNSVFPDITSWGYTEVRRIPNPTYWCIYEKNAMWWESYMYWEKVMWKHRKHIYKESQRWPANHQKKVWERRHGTASPSQPSEGSYPADTLILTAGLQNHEALSFCCVSHPVCGGWLTTSIVSFSTKNSY